MKSDEVHRFRFDFDFLRNRYDYELQRKEQLTTALTLPVAVSSVLGGAIVAMSRSFSYGETPLTWLFGTVVAADGVAFFICMMYLAGTYHRQTYVFLPLLGEIDKSREEFLDFAPAMAGGEEDVLEVFENQMRQRMIEAADRNTQTNDERAALLHRARLALYAVLLLTAVASVPYVIDQVRYWLCRDHPTRNRPRRRRCQPVLFRSFQRCRPIVRSARATC